jgi:hypothetical protein
MICLTMTRRLCTGDVDHFSPTGPNTRYERKQSHQQVKGTSFKRRPGEISGRVEITKHGEACIGIQRRGLFHFPPSEPEPESRVVRHWQDHGPEVWI